jgi:hypothetical protein
MIAKMSVFTVFCNLFPSLSRAAGLPSGPCLLMLTVGAVIFVIFFSFFSMCRSSVWAVSADAYGWRCTRCCCLVDGVDGSCEFSLVRSGCPL